MIRRRARFFDVRPAERRDVAYAVATLFVFMNAHGVLETARDALFLARLPAEKLPWVYVAMSAVGVALAWITSRPRGAPGGRRLAVILGASAVVTASLAVPASTPGTTLPYVVYVWTGLVATFGTVELWQLLGDHFTPDQAKRLYGLIGAGAIAGVVTGSALAGGLSAQLAPSWLLLVAAAISVVAALLARRVVVRVERARSVTRTSPAQVLRAEPHARKLLALVLLASLTLTIANFLFKSFVADTVAPSRLGVFFGWFYAMVNAAALVVQLVLTSAVMRWLGTVRSLAVLPAALVAGGSVFLGTPWIPILVAMKAFDGVVRHSILKTAMEILFLPLPRDDRHALKAVLEALGQRGGQALASAGILLVHGFRGGPRALVVAVVVLSLLWLLALIDVRRQYVALFRRRLRAKSADLAPLRRAPVPAVAASRSDRERLENLAEATLQRAVDLVEARVALGEHAERCETVRDLTDLLHDKSERELRRVLVLLALAHPGELDEVEAGARSADPKLRAASHEILAEVVGSPLREQLLSWLDDVGDEEKLERSGHRRREELRVVLARLASDRSESIRAAAMRCQAAQAGVAVSRA